jgi:hypothetical protein
MGIHRGRHQRKILKTANTTTNKKINSVVALKPMQNILLTVDGLMVQSHEKLWGMQKLSLKYISQIHLHLIIYWTRGWLILVSKNIIILITRELLIDLFR